MHIGADVSLFLNDGHVELEDDDHDVVDVISPLSFKVEMNNLMVSSMILMSLMHLWMGTEVQDEKKHPALMPSLKMEWSFSIFKMM